MPSAPASEPGRLFVIFALAIMLLVNLVVILITVPSAPMSKAISSLIRCVLTVALLYAIWRGQPWARWLTVGLLGVALLLVIPAAFRTPRPLLIGIMFGYAIAAGFLAFPPGVGTFLSRQRERYGSGT